jgi:hypothetical protein
MVHGTCTGKEKKESMIASSGSTPASRNFTAIFLMFDQSNSEEETKKHGEIPSCRPWLLLAARFLWSNPIVVFILFPGSKSRAEYTDQ